VLTITDSTFTGNSSTGDQAGAVYAWERVEVSDSTFTSNSAFDEAGALDGDDVVITDSTFESNSAGLGTDADGGAVHGDEGMSITDSEFTGNTADGDGGAAGVRDGTISVTGSTFTGNSAIGEGSEGGAILGQLVVDVTNSTFTDNTSDFEAGAIEAWTGGDGVMTISGSTFTNNSAVSAGGVLDTGAFFISDSTFTDNSTDDDDGGALWAELPSTLSGSEFTGNSSGDDGGGIYTESEITVTDSTFTANIADGNGGGIAADEAAVSGSTFTENEADGDGGGLVGVLVSASDSTFTDNDALDGDGGGFDSDDATVAGSSFTGNFSGRDGGAFWAEDPSTVERSTFDSNTSERDGGAVFSEDELTVSNSTFSSNTTSGRGGAIAAQAAPLALGFVTMSANVADGGGADVATFETTATMDADGTVFASTGACFLAGSVAGADNFDTGDSCGFESVSNIVDGGDPVLDPLADNGGTTQTQLPGAASPLFLAISGSNCVAVATGDLAIDQRGLSRPASSSARCSIGAANTPALVPGTPIDVDATTGADGVELSWSAPDDDGGANVTTYVIESSTDGVTWSSAADVAAASDSSGLTGAALDTTAPSVLGATSVVLPIGAAGTTTEYRVAAVNSVGQGSYSQTASVTTPAASPTDGSDDRRPATLALTGNESVGLLEFAAMLLAIGLTALMVARRLRRTTDDVRGGLRL
jgi:predicted outer membrane repeat protein